MGSRVGDNARRTPLRDVAALRDLAAGTGHPAFATPNRLRLLRGFELTIDSAVVDLPLTAQRLATFLAMHDRPVHRGQVAGVLWPHSSEDRAAASLRTALFRLRGPGAAVVETSATQLRLGAGVAVDVPSLVAVAHRLTAGESVERLDELIVAFEDELLPDRDDEWVLVWRERWRHVRLNALETLALRLADAGAFGRAVDAGLAAVAAEPLRESAHRALIRAHLLQGNHGEAMRQYAAYRRLLDRELGIEPSPVMEELVSALLPRQRRGASPVVAWPPCR
ncbi:MAG: AfsR/SARP family transcriptional regulator [Mycobacterium leprae]